MKQRKATLRGREDTRVHIFVSFKSASIKNPNDSEFTLCTLTDS